MQIQDWFRAIFYPYKDNTPQKVGGRAVSGDSSPKPLPSGRLSLDTSATLNTSGWVVQPPPDHESHWRLNDLDAEHLDVYSPKELIDMLIDMSPEISKAIWDTLRLFNPGYEVKVMALKGGSEDAEGKAHIDEFFSRLRDMYGSVDVVLNRFFMGAFLRGAFCAELVLDGEESIDLVAPDPYSVRFRKRTVPVRGEVWQAGQWQGSKFVPLDIPTFRYIPVDPAPASPYGRSLVQPALFTTLFIIGLMHDVKRVIMQQGYKRMDISIDTEQAIDAFNYDPQGYATLGEYIRGAITEMQTTYRNLQPDDAFVHTDIFALNTPAGTVDSDSIGAIDTIIERLEKMVTRALKSNSLIMDTENSTSETDSNRRWEIHAAGVKSLQHLCESMMESLLTLSLQAKGRQAKVVFRFAELRAAEMFRDEQTRALRIQNARNEYAAGFVSQDEASNSAVGHDADQPEPREPLANVSDTLLEDNSDGNELVETPDEIVENRAIDFSPVVWVNGGAGDSTKVMYR